MIRRVLLLLSIAALVSACSIKQFAVNVLGDALAEGGGVYTSDDDPELIMEAIPFGLKTYESLLAESPEHVGLLLAAARGFTGYAYMLQDKADRLDAHDLQSARELRARARNLYLRGRDYALRGLDIAHPGFRAELRRDRAIALSLTDAHDLPFLYWAGVSWAGAVSTAKGDLRLIAELPFAAALVERVLEIDETYERGAAHEFFVAYEGGRPGGSPTDARRHYERALELSEGASASVHLALAESVALQEQDLPEFRRLIAAARAIDPDEVPDLRLANTIARRRAAWLESRIPELFLEEGALEEHE